MGSYFGDILEIALAIFLLEIYHVKPLSNSFPFSVIVAKPKNIFGDNFSRFNLFLFILAGICEDYKCQAEPSMGERKASPPQETFLHSLRHVRLCTNDAVLFLLCDYVGCSHCLCPHLPGA
jgi:hypothetical protein